MSTLGLHTCVDILTLEHHMLYIECLTDQQLVIKHFTFTLVCHISYCISSVKWHISYSELSCDARLINRSLIIWTAS